VQGPDGNFYGTTDIGGTNNLGAVFELFPAVGEVAVLHSFNGGDGSYLAAPLLLLSDGSFYGTTGGGANNDGTIFVLAAPAATLSSLSPSSTSASGPAFTLTVNGSNFVSGAVVDWSGTALSTTFVSASELQASVPASLIASPGTASVTVVQNSTTSNARTFTILTTTISLTGVSLVKNADGSYTATASLTNTGFLTAKSARITKSSLGAATTKTTLPVSLGNIASGATATVKLKYPSSAGAPGTKVKLSVSGTFTGGTFSVTQSVTLP
jgi:uncharacterized repeat protein (TIGR03803 family)